MIPSITQKEAQAFLRLQNNEDFKIIKSYLIMAKNKVAYDGMSVKDETLTKWYQGSHQTLDSLIEKIDNAR